MTPSSRSIGALIREYSFFIKSRSSLGGDALTALIIDANGMVNVQSFPNSWSIFKPEYNHEFYKKLIEFRGNDLDLGWGKLGGGESKIFKCWLQTIRTTHLKSIQLGHF